MEIQAMLDEIRETWREYKGQIDRLNERLDALEALHGRKKIAGTLSKAVAPDDGTFGRAIMEAGWNLTERPSVKVPLSKALPPLETWRRVQPEQILPMSQDRRWLFPLLPSRDLGNATAVEDFRQSGRTVTGSVERDPAATTDKATLAVDIEHVTVQVRQFAVVIPDIPQQILESVETAEAFFNTEGRFVVEQAIDQHVLAQIQAASPPTSNVGANLIEQVRNAIASMRADGKNPDILVLNATDAVALDLFKQPGTQDYMFTTTVANGATPLWGLQVVEHSSGVVPTLIDRSRLGVLYRGTLTVEANPFSGFRKNTVDLRFEVNALFHVRDPQAAHQIVQSAG